MYDELLSNLHISDIVSANTIYSDKNASGKRINRHVWAIIIKYEGETEYLCNNRRFISNAQNMVLLPKGCSYEWKCLQAGHYCVVEFDSDQTLNEILSLSPLHMDKILNLMKKIEFERTRKEKTYKLECMKDMYMILLQLLNTTPKSYLPTDQKEKIQNVLDYIAQNYTQNMKNDDLARLTPYSTVYFRKLFTLVTGMSPITYLHNLRITKAKEMLCSDYSSISEIAYSLGYADIYDFSRTFKKYAGVSPTHFQKELQKKLLHLYPSHH